MRINTDGSKAYREELYEEAADLFEEGTKVGGIDAACEHARQDLAAKQEALDWMETHLQPAQARELAEILSTREISLTVDVESELTVCD